VEGDKELKSLERTKGIVQRNRHKRHGVAGLGRDDPFRPIDRVNSDLGSLVQQNDKQCGNRRHSQIVVYVLNYDKDCASRRGKAYAFETKAFQAAGDVADTIEYADVVLPHIITTSFAIGKKLPNTHRLVVTANTNTSPAARKT
jgi:hypothetical protein